MPNPKDSKMLIVSKDCWKKLMKLKLDNDKDSIEEVIQELLHK